MRVVFDAIGVRAGSTAILLRHILDAWTRLAETDELTVLTTSRTELDVPPGVRVVVLHPPMRGGAGELWLRSVGIRRAVRELGADALVSAVTASAFLGAACQRWTIVTDVRHEVRPAQFSRRHRIVRRLAYGWTFHFADGLFCISARTRETVIAGRPRLSDKAKVARLGADHVDSWPRPTSADASYAIAFGNFSNKNADRVVTAWPLVAEIERDLELRLVGMSGPERAALSELVDSLGIGGRVTLMPWLADDEFVRCFAAARLVIFPSDFEGFGLPAAEAMRLRLPLVISADPALREITGGHAVVATDLAAEPLAHAITQALATDKADLEVAYNHIASLTWAATVEAMRTQLLA